jgi:hypothetical protein
MGYLPYTKDVFRMSKKKNENEVLLLLLLLLLFLLKNLPIIIPFITPKKKNGEGTVPPEPEPVPYVPPSPTPKPNDDIAPRPTPLPAPVLLPSPSPIPKPVPIQVRRFIEDEKRYERNIPSPISKPLPEPIQVIPFIPTVKPITGTPGLLPGMRDVKVGPVTIPNPIEAILIGVPTIVGAALIPSLIPIAATAAGSSIIPAIGAKPTVSVKPKVSAPAKPSVIIKDVKVPSLIKVKLKQGKL